MDNKLNKLGEDLAASKAQQQDVTEQALWQEGTPSSSQLQSSQHRAGGATTAAEAGVLDHIFERHGKWKSENAKDSYIKDSLKKKTVYNQFQKVQASKQLVCVIIQVSICMLITLTALCYCIQ